MSRTLPVGQRHQAEPVGDLVEDPARIAGPRRRAGQVGADSRRGGPIGVPSRATGNVVSKPSTIAAICRPLGDQTGPKFSRMPTDLCGTGSNQRSAGERALPAPPWSRAPPRPTAPGWCPRGSARNTAAAPTSPPRGRRATSSDGRARSIRSCAWRSSRDATSTTRSCRFGVEEREPARRRATTRRWCRRRRRGDRGRSADRESRGPTAPSRSDEYARVPAVRRPRRVRSRRRRPGSGARARRWRPRRRRAATDRRARQTRRARRPARSPGASGRAPAAARPARSAGPSA